MNKFLFIFSLITTGNGFLTTNPVITRGKIRRDVINNLQIDNNSPSFISQTLYKKFHSYGLPWSYGTFKEQLENNNIEGITFISEQDKVNQLIVIDNNHALNEYDLYNMHNVKVIPSLFDNIVNSLDIHHINYDFVEVMKNGFLENIPGFIEFIGIYLVGSFILSIIFQFITGRGGSNNNIINPMNPTMFGKNSFSQINSKDVDVRFDDVAGCDEAKNELVEIVDFLKDPEKYNKAGAKIPKGVLLEGPPGTGKTLLAKAVAGEADVNFLYASSSQFIEMFVGVGASRVRDLFKSARDNTPCVIFLDELDAIGRQRGTGLAGGNDEREQTLNEILTNMDGFEKSDGIVIIAATNRADILDSALTRPGRFDRKVNVGLPDLFGRRKILNIHFRNKLLQDSSYLDNLAQVTNGFSGADLANLANEAAILSVRNNNTEITPVDMYNAFEKMTIGLPVNVDRRSNNIKNMVSYHEIGHALITYLFSDMYDLQAVTINANRNGAGGYTLFTPKPSQENYPTKKFLLSNIMIALGGRAAEYIIYKDTVFYNDKYGDLNIFKNVTDLYITTGASNDLKQANSLARRYISLFGMGDNMALYDSADTSQPFLGRNLATNNDKLSEYSKQEIDKEIEKIVNMCYEQSINILSSNKYAMDKLSKKLLNKQTIYKNDFDNLNITFFNVNT